MSHPQARSVPFLLRTPTCPSRFLVSTTATTSVSIFLSFPFRFRLGYLVEMHHHRHLSSARSLRSELIDLNVAAEHRVVVPKVGVLSLISAGGLLARKDVASSGSLERVGVLAESIVDLVGEATALTACEAAVGERTSAVVGVCAGVGLEGAPATCEGAGLAVVVV
jgi:hypothetical protein